MNNSERAMRTIPDLQSPIDWYKKAFYEAMLHDLYSIWNNDYKAWRTYGTRVCSQYLYEMRVNAYQQFPRAQVILAEVQVLGRIGAEFSACHCGSGKLWRDCDCGRACRIKLFYT